jgi:hypothetical protein
MSSIQWFMRSGTRPIKRLVGKTVAFWRPALTINNHDRTAVPNLYNQRRGSGAHRATTVPRRLPVSHSIISLVFYISLSISLYLSRLHANCSCRSTCCPETVTRGSFGYMATSLASSSPARFWRMIPPTDGYCSRTAAATHIISA